MESWLNEGGRTSQGQPIMRAENDDTKRFEMYHEMEKIIIEEAPVVPLFYDEVLRFSQKNISGLTANGLNLLNLKRVKIQ